MPEKEPPQKQKPKTKSDGKPFDDSIWLALILFARQEKAAKDGDAEEEKKAKFDMLTLLGFEDPDKAVKQINRNIEEKKDFFSGVKIRDDFDRSNPDIQTGRKAVLQSQDGLLALLAKHESGGDYNKVYGFNQKKDFNRDGKREIVYDPNSGVMFHGQRRFLTDMTINEVMEWQHDYTRKYGSRSSAAGCYQMLEKTLRGTKDALGLTGNEKFDAAMQDQMALHLMNGRGYQSYLAGKMTTEQWALNLSKEWASLPDPRTGRSYYAGDGLNKSGHSVSSVRDVLENDKAQGGLNSADAKNPFAAASTPVTNDVSATTKTPGGTKPNPLNPLAS